jgi:hypothetical protein
MLDSSNKQLRQQFVDAFSQRSQHLRKLSEQLSAGLLSFNSAENVMSVLARAYGKRRNAARSRGEAKS